MATKTKTLCLCVFAFVLALAGGFALGGCAKGSNIAYINTVEDFNAHFQTQKVLYVDDLDFGVDTALSINRSIKLVGKNEKSTLSNVFINISAPNVVGERIVVEFENIIFDGAFNKSGFNLTLEDSFGDIFGNRDNKHCITASVGHYNLTIENCDFTNYASEYGSVMFVNNDLDSFEDKIIRLNNSKFYGNICKRGTLDIFHDKANVTITNCQFFENYGAIGAGFNVGNGRLFVDNCIINNNNFCKFNLEDASGQEAGGGVAIGAFDGKVRNTKITNNKSVFGGGLSVVLNHTGDNTMLIENCTITNNQAIKNGGGVMIDSKQGQTVSFIGCEISFNHAPSSANVCSIPMAGWWTKNKSGNVNFFFCKIAMNEGADNKGISTDLDFYGLTNNQSQMANTQVKGCIIIDKTTLTAQEGHYNYIATPAQAEADGVIDVSAIAEKRLCLLDNAKTNIFVPASVYSLWHAQFVGANNAAQIGQFVYVGTQTANATLIIALSIVAMLVVVAGVGLLAQRNKKQVAQNVNASSATTIQIASTENAAVASTQPTAQVVEAVPPQAAAQKEGVERGANISFSPAQIEQIVANWALVQTLSKKEKEVFELRLAGKKRRDIAKKQFVSENTIKKQLINIYLKLEVANGKAMIENAQKYLNK